MNNLNNLHNAIDRIYSEVLNCDYSVTHLVSTYYSSPIDQSNNQRVLLILIKDELPNKVFVKYIIDGETFIENTQGPINFTDKSEEYIFNKIKKIYQTMEMLS